MKTKIIPFDLETAKKIQAGEIEGRIVTRDRRNAIIVDIPELKNNRYPMSVVIKSNYKDYPDILLNYDWSGIFSDYIKEGDNDLFIELPEEAPEEQHPIEESELYQAGYKVGFEAGRCVAFDEKKGCAIKEAPKHDDVEEVPTGDGSIVFLRHKKHEFKPFDKVLVYNSLNGKWFPNFFSHIASDGRIVTITNSFYESDEVVNYEGNEHLVGTTDKPKEIC